MNEVTQALYKSVVEPAIRKIQQSTRGTVLEYDNKHNLATIEFQSAYSNATTKLYNVPVQVAGGIHPAGPFPGDEVWINFVNGDIGTPQIVACADRVYNEVTRERQNKHTNKGVYVPDSICGRPMP